MPVHPMNLTGQCCLPAGVSGEGNCGPPLRKDKNIAHRHPAPEPNYAKANINLWARGVADRRCGIGIFLTYILLKARSSAKAAFIALLFATDKRTAAAEQKC